MHRLHRIRGAPRRGGVLTSLTLLLVLGALAWFLWVLRTDVEAANYTRVDTARARLDTGSGWVDPRWEGLVRERLARLPAFACDDPQASALVARELESLSFVRSLQPAEVLWPDGLRVRLSLRAPIACVQVGREYLPIAADGMLLSGAWPSPPACGSGFLPVLALPEAARAELRAGTVLWNDVVADGLSVASSMWSELDDQDLARLGRSIIDARKARATSVEEPGTVIHLEHSRRILFGRAPSMDAPGELPVATKWLHVANALASLPAGAPATPDGPPVPRPGEVDWELVEARWDHPAMLPRGGGPEGRVPVRSVKAAKPKPPPGAPAPQRAPPAGPKLGRVQ